MATTQTTRTDAILGVVEDILLMAVAFIATYKTGGSFQDAAVAAGATQAGKGLLAVLLSQGWTSRVTKLLPLLWSGINTIEAAQPKHAAPSSPEPIPAAPVPVAAPTDFPAPVPPTGV